ncbi:related to carbonic anhydrase [Sporisorium reilianum f. sp. reilianum]|uniref:Carbonic anhydrase n=1 Tax=Sporisorium reilianum f. sp. reilianum TaxID=72559 RepID=A0A2N8U7F9_9BASI|nr:related to carbonic anhydrase [Sporisorium reilianum f. sp. reilianum]
MYTALARTPLFSLARRQRCSPSDLVQRLASIRTLSTTPRAACRTTTPIRSHSTASSSTHTSPSMLQVSDLLSKNKAWSASFCANKPELAVQLAQTQEPKILWIGCADSRVPESVVCECDPGEIFVTRNIANQFRLDDDNALSVLTFAVQALGIEHVVVVGHTSCGGVNAAIAGASAPPSQEALESSALLRHLVPLTQVAKKVVDANPGLPDAELAQKVIYESVKLQVNNIVSTSIIQDNWNGVTSPLSGKVMNKVQVHGLCYDIAKAQLVDLDLTRSSA